MIRKLGNLIVIAVIAAAVGACGSTPEKPQDKRTRPLEVPPDLSALPPDDSFTGAALLSETQPRPKVTGDQQSTGRPRDPIVDISRPLLPQYEAIKMRKAGTQRWLVVMSEAEPLWFGIRSFLQKYNLEIMLETPETGIMETNWIESRPLVAGETKSLLSSVLGSLYATGVRDKYRIRLERGEEAGTMEVYISHQGMEEVVASGGGVDVAETVWQPRENSPELEVEMLRLLMVHLGTSESMSKEAAKAIQSSEQARMTEDKNGVPLLLLGDPLDRAWRRVGLALDRVNFTVQDRDRALWVYYVRYFDPNAKKKSGVFSWLIGDDEEEGPQHYQVKLESRSEGTAVRVLNKEGEALEGKTGKRILKLLHDQLR